MCAMVRYALDGNGEPQLKAELTNGKTRNMFCETSDRKPEFTRIGDKQYHHFAVRVPEGTKTLKLNLRPKNGYNNYDLFLLAAPGHFAYLGDAAYKDLSTGAGERTGHHRPQTRSLLCLCLLQHHGRDRADPIWHTLYRTS